MSANRKICTVAVAVLLGLCTAGCVVPGGYAAGYRGGDVGVSYGVNLYEPFDNNGWWGPGYLVGPSRGDRDGSHHEDRGRTHAWHTDPGERHPMPSLPHGRPGGSDRGGHDHEGHH